MKLETASLRWISLLSYVGVLLDYAAHPSNSVPTRRVEFQHINTDLPRVQVQRPSSNILRVTVECKLYKLNSKKKLQLNNQKLKVKSEFQEMT